MKGEIRKLKLEELGRASIQDYKSQDKIPITVILDNIRSGMNVGSIFRTSDAFAIERILLCGISARPPHKEILKTAIGATNSVYWEYHESVANSIRLVQSEGYQVIGIEQTTSSVSIDDIEVDTECKYAIVLGNEVDGISEAVLPLLDHALEIPQYGTKHSLNVAVCGGIVLWHFAQPYHAVKKAPL